MKKYGYMRVSEFRKLTNTNSLEGQREALLGHGVNASNIFTDTLTSTKLVFPELDRLLPLLRKGDILVVATLDRIARTLADGASLVTTLNERGIWVHILNIGLMDNSSTGKLLYDTLLTLAKYERDMIVERTSVGKARRREEGKPDGRPKKYSKEQLDHAMGLLAEGKSGSEVEKLTGISRSTLQREQRDREAAILSSNNDISLVKRDEPSVAVPENGMKAQALNLLEELATLKSFGEERDKIINELEGLQSCCPDDDMIADCLAQGCLINPRKELRLVQHQKNADTIKGILNRHKNGEFAIYLAKALAYLLLAQKEWEEKDKTMELLIDLSNEYIGIKGVAEYCAYGLVSCSDTAPQRSKKILLHIAILLKRFDQSEFIREYYERAKMNYKSALESA